VLRLTWYFAVSKTLAVVAVLGCHAHGHPGRSRDRYSHRFGAVQPDGTFTLTWTFANQVAQDLTITDASITAAAHWSTSRYPGQVGSPISDR
jgi:hypothetical protein